MNLITAANLHFAHGPQPVWQGLSFTLQPGLSWVRGGDGRGKTTLLQVLAGELAPTSGELQRAPGTVYWRRPTDAEFNDVPADTWLAELRPVYPDWDAARQAEMVAAYGLAEHLHKPLYMLSAGSRRKVGLVGAAAAGAVLTLLDAPFAALDTASCRVLTAWLEDCAAHPSRACVVADYELPAGLDAASLARLIDLGD